MKLDRLLTWVSLPFVLLMAVVELFIWLGLLAYWALFYQSGD